MALELESFGQGGLSIEDFKLIEGPKVPLSMANASMIAATDTAITGPSLNEYRQVRDMIADPESRPDYVERRKQVQEAVMGDAQEEIINAASDPTIVDEVRNTLINSVAANQSLSRGDTSELDVLAEEAVIGDAGVNETLQASDSRMRYSDILRDVNAQKIQIMKAINQVRVGLDQSTLGALVDVGEMMVPLAEYVHINEILADLGPNAASEDVSLLGTQKQTLYNLVRDLPIEQRGEFASRLVDLVMQHDNVVLPDGNALVALDTLEKALLNNDYSDFERWFDNVTTVLDVVGVGSAARGFGRLFKGGRVADFDPQALDAAGVDNLARVDKATIDTQYDDAILREARTETTTTDVPPTAPSQIVKDANPEEARRMHQLAVTDETGEMAEALYGTTREEAAAKDLLPEPEVREGHMPNKVSQAAPDTKEPLPLKEARERDGNTYLTEVEVQTTKQNLIDGLENLEGMKVHKESLVIKTGDDSTFSVRARYSPRDSGFRSAAEALDNARFAFRNYRFDDGDFQVVARMGDSWVQVSPEDANAMETLRRGFEERGLQPPSDISAVDYAIELDTNYNFRPEDLTEYEVLSVRRNYLDRVPANGFSLAARGQGSLTQNLFDAASVLHPQIVQPASVAVDRANHLKALYVDEFNKFSKGYGKLSKDRREAMAAYINEANLEGLKFDITDLMARGFDEKEIDMLKEWRRSNDAMWYASNADMAQTLRQAGNEVFVHNYSNTYLVGRPLARGSVNQGSVMYDPVADSLTTVDQLDDLYDSGGGAMRLADPIEVNGQWTDLVLNRNTPSGGYARVIRDNEKVLAYRDGYYPVMYDARWFVTMRVRSADGRTLTKVVASAKDTADRNRALEKLRTAHPEAEFDARLDRRREQTRGSTIEDGGWQIASSGGFSSQRVRGERLKDAGVDLHKAGITNLVDPLEAVAGQIQQMTTKVAMRPWLEATKARWMNNYGKYLDIPQDVNTGRTMFPRSITDVKAKAETPSKMASDARTLFNYIYSMENGYINNIDEAYRATLNFAASEMGRLGLIKAERVLDNASQFSPNNAAKSAAFKLLLAANPARQFIIQRAQILTLPVANPTYFARGFVSDSYDVLQAMMGNTRATARGKEIWKEIQESGLDVAVDANNFIRDDLLRMADLTIAQKSLSTINKPLDFTRRWGFDEAERHVLISAYLVFRDKAVQAGKDLKSQRVKDEILGEVRAYTLNMNRAGDQPYARNTAALATQFFSVQHKALLQGLTNRNLKKADRLKLLAYTTALFGVESGPLILAWSAISGSTPPNELKDTIKDGLLDFTLNWGLTLASGEDQNIDWGDLAPSEAYGLGNVLISMISTGVGEAVANSPGGSLLFGANPRITEAFKTSMRYFHVSEDYDDPELDTKYSDVVLAGASLFSGYSNSFKANYAFHTGKKVSSTGRISDADVTKVEAVLASFGFQTKTERGYREIREIEFAGRSFQDDDVRKWYTDLKRQLARRGTSTREDDLAQRTLSEAWAVFGQDRPKAVGIISTMIQRDAQNGDYLMMTNLIKKMGLSKPDDVWKMVNRLPAGQMRDQLSGLLQAIEEQNNGN